MQGIVFGPVQSRRFGRSLGVDLSPNKKQCNFDCVYCELSGAKSVEKFDDILPLETLIKAVSAGLKANPNIDVLTISANGEPTLYPHLADFMREIKPKIPRGVKSLILSNGSKFGDSRVQAALQHFDMVKFSLDSGREESFKKIDRIHKNLSLESIKNGIKSYAKIRQNALICEILLVENINDNFESLAPLAKFLREIEVDRIDIGTIDRPPAYRVNPVSAEKIKALAEIFSGLCVSLPARKNAEDSRNSSDSHADSSESRESAESQDSRESKTASESEILNLLKRRPLEVCEARRMFARNLLESLESSQKIARKSVGLIDFYIAKNI